MATDDQLKAESAKLESKPGASSVSLGEDGFLKVVIDLNVPNEMFIETRVGAYGTLEWARELVQRSLMFAEMQYSKKKALEAQKNTIPVVPMGVIDPSKMGAPKGMRP
jgi:predicted molibdopterin-dependent oxidoreductase YjgC